jgi:hypothetical protein
MHVLISFCNAKAPGLPALALLDPVRLEVRVLELPETVRECNGITGLASNDQFIFAVAQPSKHLKLEAAAATSLLLILDRHDLRLHHHYIFQHGVDVHSLCLSNKALFAVSSGTDEIIKLDLSDGKVRTEKVFWRLEPKEPRQDCHHLNGIVKWRGDLVFSAFGKKEADQWSSSRDGFIWNLTRKEKLAVGLQQPHSLSKANGFLAYCESRRMLVRLVDDPRSQRLMGYTRGLCCLGSKLFVGTSFGRQISKSTGTINNPAANGLLEGRCTVSRLSFEDFQIEETIDLSAHAQEIYDLLPVDGAGHWPVAGELAWRNLSLRKLTMTLDERTRLAKHATAEVAHRNTTIEALKKQIEVSQQLAARLQNELKVNKSNQKLLESALERERQARELLEASVAANYADSLPQIREVVRSFIPAEATVLVVSKGDNELLKLEGRQTWHFPRDERGEYAGYYPADSARAIAHLESLIAQGGQFLLFPAAAFWWLEHYHGFQEYLDQHHERIATDARCIIFKLSSSPTERQRPANACPIGTSHLVLAGNEPGHVQQNEQKGQAST